jgi:hypothetical protein
VPATSYGATICFAIINGGILGVFWMVRSSMKTAAESTDSFVDDSAREC